ncbi:MAG: helix-hairpin-helix domain-containing protein [Paludibacteraceae bacterium]
MTQKEKSLLALRQIPGVGISIAKNLFNIGIHSVEDLIGQEPEKLFERSNQFVGVIQDRCLLYVFRCSVYYANTDPLNREIDKLLWWNWKNDSDCDYCKHSIKFL